jgi:hypothetical protein
VEQAKATVCRLLLLLLLELLLELLLFEQLLQPWCHFQRQSSTQSVWMP